MNWNEKKKKEKGFSQKYNNILRRNTLKFNIYNLVQTRFSN